MFRKIFNFRFRSIFSKLSSSPLLFHQADENIPLTGFYKVVKTAVFNDSTAFGLKWSHSQVSDIGCFTTIF